MILKIKDNGTGMVDEPMKAWWIYGELDKCHYYILKTPEFKHDGYDYDLMLINSDKELEDNTECIVFHLRFINNKEMSIIVGCNIPCYLCNNDGKTIEKVITRK